MHKRLKEILTRMGEIRSALLEAEAAEDAATDENPLPDDHSQRVADLVAEFDRLEEERAPLQAEHEARERVRSFSDRGLFETGDDRTAPQLQRKVDPTGLDLRSASRGEVRSAALAVLEREHKDQKVELSERSAGHIESLIGAYSVADDGEVILDGDKVAKRLLITETPAYRSAFQRALKGQASMWTDEEKQAMARAAEQSLTSASGGYAVPVLIDPTVIITSGAAGAPVVDMARIEPITNNKWVGVSSAGVAFANVAESTAATAQQATLAQPEVAAHKIAAFIPFSLEIEGDWPRFASEMERLLDQAYIDYLAVKTINGTGSIEMFGIFTAIGAGQSVVTTSSGQLAPEDALLLWNAVPERYRSRSNWLSNVNVESTFRKGEHGLFTVDLTAEGIGVMNGKRYFTSDYAPAWSSTTGALSIALLGDFSNYVIAQRVGMSIELIPHVFDSDGLPKGQRGWYAWARVGGDSVNDNAFRKLTNKTS